MRKICFVLVFSLTANVFADLRECADGTWTNASCEGDKTVRVMEEQEKAPPSEEELALREKRQMLSDLQLKSEKVRRVTGQYQIRTKLVVDHCFEKTTSVADCREKVMEKDSILDQVLARRSGTEIASESHTTNITEENTVNQVIVNQDRNWDGFYRDTRRPANQRLNQLENSNRAPNNNNNIDNSNENTNPSAPTKEKRRGGIPGLK